MNKNLEVNTILIKDSKTITDAYNDSANSNNLYKINVNASTCFQAYSFVNHPFNDQTNWTEENIQEYLNRIGLCYCKLINP